MYFGNESIGTPSMVATDNLYPDPGLRSRTVRFDIRENYAVVLRQFQSQRQVRRNRLCMCPYCDGRHHSSSF